MEFSNRIKKEISEGLVKAILVDAGYRVISSGIESLIRETEIQNPRQFGNLGVSKTLTSLPDYIVMDGKQTEMHTVEVKYRKNWETTIFEEVHHQVSLLGELTLICFNANPKIDRNTPSASTYLRCCQLKMEGDNYLINRYKASEFKWVNIEEVKRDDEPWFRLAPLQFIFKQIDGRKDEETLLKSVMAIESVFENF